MHCDLPTIEKYSLPLVAAENTMEVASGANNAGHGPINKPMDKNEAHSRIFDDLELIG